MWVFANKLIRFVLKINGEEIQRVSSIKYIGTILEDNCTSKKEKKEKEKEIKAWIEQAGTKFANMKNLFIRRELKIELKLRMLRWCVSLILYHGCEAWEIDLEKRVPYFWTLYIHRRMLRISCIEKITNMEVLDRLDNQPNGTHWVQYKGKKTEIFRTFYTGIWIKIKYSSTLQLGRWVPACSTAHQ